MSKIDLSILFNTDELNSLDLSDQFSPLPADILELLPQSDSNTSESQFNHSESSLSLEEFLQTQTYSDLLDHSAGTPSGWPPENQSNHQEITNSVSQAAAVPENMEMNFERSKIIAQPFFGNKLRYRSDYEKNENRLGVLKNRNKNSNYQGPAIQIPQKYLDTNGGYFVRVTLVTVPYNQTNLHYIHPYELEHPLVDKYNERSINTVWFPIENEDCLTGIKSFPALRIVKKRASDLKTFGNLRAFDSQYPNTSNNSNNSIPQLKNAKDTILEFNLNRSQLAFTIGRQLRQDDQTFIEMYPNSTVFSEEMIERDDNEIDTNQDAQLTNEKPFVQPSICRVYQYAPRYGFDVNEEIMVIFLTKKLEPRKYGDLQVIFECDIPDDRWTQSIVALDIKDRMVSFKTPAFPHFVDMIKEVNVILKQKDRTIDTIKYFYLSTKNQCLNCQSNAIQNPTILIPNIPHKRPLSFLGLSDFENDSLVPDNSPSPTTTTNTSDETLKIFAQSIENLFRKNDYEKIFRMSRAVLKNSPHLLHEAIEKDYSELLKKFIPTSVNVILQQKNSQGETALLHSIRLNRIEIVQAILDKSNSQVLLEDFDSKQNNIFHLIAIHSNTLDMFDLLINYLQQKQIPIEKHFDYVNDDHLTPLQLSIHRKNFPIMKVFLKYFDRNIYQTKILTGDNLVHLAVRTGDLDMVKYLIENENLIEQGNQSNLQSTPKELAKILGRNEIVEYFNQIYPENIIEDNENSDDD